MDSQGALKKYFGYDAFRPLQQEIIDDALSGHDVFALLPTGGGKSLCFQLPALLRDGVTIVVSPLIALMKDQVDALRTSGIAATFLNSTLAGSESRERLRGLDRNEFRLLYVAPERLMMENFLERALNWNIAQIAIDEAHCISEWGHDFRPEYRELKKLRTHFPDVPIMALTATATERVRDDIIKQLKLHPPRCYVASFNRPNLTYRVVAKSSSYQQVLEFIRATPRNSGVSVRKRVKASSASHTSNCAPWWRMRKRAIAGGRRCCGISAKAGRLFLWRRACRLHRLVVLQPTRLSPQKTRRSEAKFHAT